MYVEILEILFIDLSELYLAFRFNSHFSMKIASVEIDKEKKGTKRRTW